MKEFITWMDSLPLFVKVIFALPCLDIIWGIYRIMKAIDAKNNTALAISIVVFILGGWNIWFIVDIIAIIVTDKHSVIDFLGVK
jgi:hypothetical protein